MNEDVKQNAWHCGFSGLMMLAFAYWYGALGPSPELDGAVYVRSFDVFNLTLRAGGALLLVAAGLSAAGIGVAALMEVIVSGLSGVLMLGCAVCWIVSEGGLGPIDLLALVLGLILAHAGIRSLGAYRAGMARRSVGTDRGRAASGELFGSGSAHVSKPTVPEPVHPASLASDALPKAGDAPPEEGYLAALSKEQDDPPSDRDA